MGWEQDGIDWWYDPTSPRLTVVAVREVAFVDCIDCKRVHAAELSCAEVRARLEAIQDRAVQS